MNSRLNILILAGAVILGFSLTGTAFAQRAAQEAVMEDRIQGDPLAGMELATIDCAEVNWDREMLAEYPWSPEACHDVVISGGEHWARFEIDFLGREPDGTVRAEFIGPDERSHGVVNLEPGDNQRVLLDGQPYTWDEVFEGQRLSLFAPEGEFGFAGTPDASRAELARRADEAPPVEDDEQMRLAEAEEDPFAERPRELPATAGPLPMLGLAGLLSLLGGMALTIRRRLGRPTV